MGRAGLSRGRLRSAPPGRTCRWHRSRSPSRGARRRPLPHRPHRALLAGGGTPGRPSRSAGPPVEVALLQSTAAPSDTISEGRLVIGGLLVAVLLLAMLAAAVSRALTGQIGTFLDAARRRARGDFTHSVPVSGRDEFAGLGHEYQQHVAARGRDRGDRAQARGARGDHPPRRRRARQRSRPRRRGRPGLAAGRRRLRGQPAEPCLRASPCSRSACARPSTGCGCRAWAGARRCGSRRAWRGVRAGERRRPGGAGRRRRPLSTGQNGAGTTG